MLEDYAQASCHDSTSPEALRKAHTLVASQGLLVSTSRLRLPPYRVLRAQNTKAIITYRELENRDLAQQDEY